MLSRENKNQYVIIITHSYNIENTQEGENRLYMLQRTTNGLVHQSLSESQITLSYQMYHIPKDLSIKF